MLKANFFFLMTIGTHLELAPHCSLTEEDEGAERKDTEAQIRVMRRWKESENFATFDTEEVCR